MRAAVADEALDNVDTFEVAGEEDEELDGGDVGFGFGGREGCAAGGGDGETAVVARRLLDGSFCWCFFVLFVDWGCLVGG